MWFKVGDLFGSLASSALAIATIATALPDRALAQSSLFESSRVLGHADNECGGVPSCKSVRGARVTIAAGKSDVVTLNCPPIAPYVVAWDTEQSEAIEVKIISHKFHPNSALSVGAENRSFRAGYVILFLGCSAQKPPRIGMMHHRGGVPSRIFSFGGR